MQQLDGSDLRQLQQAVGQFAEKYGLRTEDVLSLIECDSIPVTAFNDVLSPLETTVKYLKERLGRRLCDIAKLMNKDQASVWTAYRNASKKHPQELVCAQTQYTIPLTALQSDKLSILELIVTYLRVTYGLSFRSIGELLKRNERTVWTSYDRARKKLASGLSARPSSINHEAGHDKLAGGGS